MTVAAQFFGGHPVWRACIPGGLAIGVPGEIRGFYEAWKMFGRVDWAALFEPSIRLLEKGFEIEPSVVVYVKWFEDSIRRDANLRCAHQTFVMVPVQLK